MFNQRLLNRRRALKLGLSFLAGIGASACSQFFSQGPKAQVLDQFNEPVKDREQPFLNFNNFLAFNPDEIVGAQIDESKIKRTIHVDINHGKASDTNSGSNTSPLKSLGAALKQAKKYLKKGEGTKITIYPGVYREGELVIDGKKLGSKAKDALLVQAGRNNPPVIEGVIHRVNSDNPNLVEKSLKNIQFDAHSPRQVNYSFPETANSTQTDSALHHQSLSPRQKSPAGVSCCRWSQQYRY